MGEGFIMITLDTGKYFFQLFVPIFVGFEHILLFVNTSCDLIYEAEDVSYYNLVLYCGVCRG